MYWAEYLLDTVHLDFERHGAYIKVLAIYYQAGKAPEANFERLCKMTHATTDRERMALRDVLKEFFPVKNGRYTNKRAEIELREKRSRSDAARDSANKRWKK